MARQQNIGSSQDWFIGEDKTLEFEIYSADDATIQDVSGMAMQFSMRRGSDSDPIVLTCTTGASTITITGAHNADPLVNTQRTNVIIADTDTDNLQPGNYAYALKRTTAGSETILAYGTIALKKAAL